MHCAVQHSTVTGGMELGICHVSASVVDSAFIRAAYLDAGCYAGQALHSVLHFNHFNARSHTCSSGGACLCCTLCAHHHRWPAALACMRVRQACQYHPVHRQAPKPSVKVWAACAANAQWPCTNCAAQCPTVCQVVDAGEWFNWCVVVRVMSGHVMAMHGSQHVHYGTPCPAASAPS